MSNKLRPIAIYLPQFHPIPENDKWWGKGFTEWTNVTKAKPLFKGHYQPHLPADLGFYDLRLEESRLAQEKMAKEYGIYGFCYYHYWFNGKKVLNEPLDRKMKNSKEDLPFMMCWANENWTRAWDGSENEILLEQNYSEDDHRNHIQHLIPYFKDSRYIKVDGKPVFVIYRTNIIPDIENAVRIWRETAAKENLNLYIIRFEGLKTTSSSYKVNGLDAVAEFQPLSAIENKRMEKTKKKGLKSEFSLSAFSNSVVARFINLKNKFAKKNQYYKYSEIVESDILYDYPSNEKIYRCVSPGWDNSSRKKNNFLIIKDSKPSLFRKWVEAKIDKFIPFSNDENFFFINAWNEWAEGNHMEPDRKWGKSYLEELKKALDKTNNLQ